MKKKNVFARLQYVRYVQINIVLYSINNYFNFPIIARSFQFSRTLFRRRK